MEDTRTAAELIADSRQSLEALEDLIRQAGGEAPDIPSITAEEYHDAYDEGFHFGYAGHRHDVFVPMMIMTTVALGGGIVIGLLI